MNNTTCTKIESSAIGFATTWQRSVTRDLSISPLKTYQNAVVPEFCRNITPSEFRADICDGTDQSVNQTEDAHARRLSGLLRGVGVPPGLDGRVIECRARAGNACLYKSSHIFANISSRNEIVETFNDHISQL